MQPELLTDLQWQMLFGGLLSICYFVGFAILEVQPETPFGPDFGYMIWRLDATHRGPKWAIDPFSAALLGALSFLLGYAVIPSVLYPPFNYVNLRYQRGGLYFIAIASLALAIYQFARAMGLIVPVISQIFPRWWI